MAKKTKKRKSSASIRARALAVQQLNLELHRIQTVVIPLLKEIEPDLKIEVSRTPKRFQVSLTLDA